MSEHFLASLPHLAAKVQKTDATGLIYSILINPDQVRPAAMLCQEKGLHLEDVTVSELKEGSLVLYHYDHFDCPGRVSVMAVSTNNSFDSIADIHPGADWHERECFDFYGTQFVGHKNLLPLLLPPDVETPPLKKDDASKVALATLFPWAAPQAEQKEA